MTLLFGILVLALGTFGLRSVGFFFGGAASRFRLQPLLALLPLSLLAALIVAQTFGSEAGLTLDARSVGLAAGGLALVLRAPFVAVIVLAALATAAGRAAGLG